MMDALIDTHNQPALAIQGLLRKLLESGAVDALLVPMALPAGNTTPMLVTDPAALDRAQPLTPLLPINAARAASQLTLTGHASKLGLVLRACEIRALVELVKFQQAKLDNALIIGIDCLGAYPVADWQAAPDREKALEQMLAQAPGGDLAPVAGLEFREACRICELPLPEGPHVALTLGLVGVESGQLYVQARDDLAQALELTPAATPAGAPAGRKAARDKLVAARTQARDEAFAAIRARTNSMDGLLAEFSTCIRCHNCMTNCPICYCRECIFHTPTFEHESQLYFQWAERKGSVRLLSDTLLFHLTRLNHMATSCVGCGVCTEACPVDIPVGTLFRSVGQQVQAIFDYHPGRSLDEAAPVQEFREDELTTLGTRPHA